MTSSTLLRILAEAEEAGAEHSGPEPWAVGLTAFVVLLLALFVVTRLNKDR